MLLSCDFAPLLLAFAPLFGPSVWCQAQVLLAGAILAPGKRTVTAVLRIMGLSQERHFQTYHWVLNRAAWSSLAANRILLGLLVRALPPEAFTENCLCTSAAFTVGVEPVGFAVM